MQNLKMRICNLGCRFRFDFNRCRPCSFGALVLAVLLGWVDVSASLGVQEDSRSRAFLPPTNSRFVPVSREVIRPLIRASRAIDEGEFNRAAELVGQFLLDAPEDDYLVAGLEPEAGPVGLKFLAESMLAKLPESAIKAYRLRFGVVARHKLETAVAERDLQAIQDVAKRFFFTEAGEKAALLNGQLQLDQGNPVSAATSFGKVALFSPNANRHEPALSILLATCYALSGEEPLAKDTLIELKKNLPVNEVVFNGRKVVLFDNDEESIDWLNGLIGPTRQSFNRKVADWRLFGGNVQRNAESEPGLPFHSPVWEIDFERPTRYSTGAKVRTTCATGDTVIIERFHQTIGVDFETGKQRWAFPFPGDVEEPFDSALNTRSWALSSQSRVVDTTGHQASTDGTRVYILPFLQTDKNRFQSVYGNYPVHTRLAAVNLEAEGRLEWMRENELAPGLKAAKLVEETPETLQAGLGKRNRFGNDVIGEELNRVIVRSSPLPIGDKVFLLVYQAGMTSLVELEAATGEVVWRLPLAANESTGRSSPMIGLPLCIAYSQGILVCPTGAGGLVGIDLANRNFLWGNHYALSRRTSTRWHQAKMIIHGNAVVFTPPESSNLMCVDLKTGRALDDFPAEGCDAYRSIRLACVHQDHAILLGTSDLHSISLKDGKRKWNCPLSSFGLVAGEGFASKDHYHVATKDRFVVKIDLVTGKVVDFVETKKELGNLTAFRGTVISLNEEGAACFQTDATAARRLKLAIEKYGAIDALPEDWKVNRSRLLAKQKKWSEAWEALGDAGIEKVTDDQEVSPVQRQRALLLGFLMEKRVKNALQIADDWWDKLTESQRKQLFPILIDCLIHNGEYQRAIGSLQKWSKVQPSLSIESDGAELEDFIEVPISMFDQLASKDQPDSMKPRRMARMSPTKWFRWKLQSILDASASNRSFVADMVRDSIESAKDQLPDQELESWIKLHRYLQRFPGKAIPIEQLDDVIEALVSKKEMPRAKQLLLQVTGFDPVKTNTKSNRQVKMPVALLWMRYLTKLRDKRSANAMLARVQNEQLVLTGESDREELLDQMRKMVGPRTQKVVKAATPYDGMYKCVASVEPRNSGTIMRTPIHVHQTRFSQLRDLSFSVMSTNEIRVTDSIGKQIGEFSIQKSLSSIRNSLELEHDDALGLLKFERYIAVVNLAKLGESNPGAFLWNRNVSATRNEELRLNRNAVGEFSMWNRTPSRRQPVSNVSVNGICLVEHYPKKNTLRCLDPFTAKVQWERPVEILNPVVFGDNDQVVLLSLRSRKASVFELASGRKIKEVLLPERMSGFWDNAGGDAISIGVVTDARLAMLQSGEPEKFGGDFVSRSTAPTGSSLLIGRFDFDTEKFVWINKYVAGAKATRMSLGRIAIQKADGSVTIIDRTNGESISNFKDDRVALHKKRTRTIGSVAVGGNDLLVFQEMSGTMSRFSVGSNVTAERPFTFRPLIQGGLVLVDQESSSPVWNKSAYLTGCSVMPFVSNSAPLLLLHRRVKSTSSTRKTGVKLIPRCHHIVGLDKASGRMMLNYLYPVETVSFKGQVQWNEMERQLQLPMYQNLVKISLRGSPDSPPSPIAYQDRTNKLPPFESSVLVKVFDPTSIKKSMEMMKLAAQEAEKKLVSERELERKRILGELNSKQ